MKEQGELKTALLPEESTVGAFFFLLCYCRVKSDTPEVFSELQHLLKSVSKITQSLDNGGLERCVVN